MLERRQNYDAKKLTADSLFEASEFLLDFPTTGQASGYCLEFELPSEYTQLSQKPKIPGIVAEGPCASRTLSASFPNVCGARRKRNLSVGPRIPRVLWRTPAPWRGCR